MEKILKLTAWDANVLTKYSHEDKAFILSRDIDILLVSETHFPNKRYFRIPVHTLYHAVYRDGEAHGGITSSRNKKQQH